MVLVRGRLAPLAVRPFGRLLSSYTINELGDSVGLVALAVLVYDRTDAVAPTDGVLRHREVPAGPARAALTARIDQVSVRRSLPTLYALEAVVFAPARADRRRRLPACVVLILGLVDGTLALTGRALTRGAVADVLQARRVS